MSQESVNINLTGRDQEWRVKLRSDFKNKDRTQLERVKMPEVEALERIKSNVEVNIGISTEDAVNEAKRCIDCANPTCIEGCPVNINIPGFIKHVEAGNFFEAAKVLKDTNTLPAVCGRVCPQEIQCEANCFYTQKLKKPAVAIGHLERFVADFERTSDSISIPTIKVANHKKVAIVGSGPAGLACAADLAKMGYDVTVFEALHEIGGVLKYGIPEFRLPNEIVDTEIKVLRQMGVKFMTSFLVGRTASVQDLKDEGFQAFFIGSGAGLPNFMKIPGENAIGIYSSNEFLTRVNLMGARNANSETPVLCGKNVAVIGGGNTAMDSVRTAKRLGAERALIVYRRSLEEMPARLEEIHHAQEEGIEFMVLTNPIEYFADENGRVNKMTVQRMELGEPDASGRSKPIVIPNSEYTLDVDTVIVSVGVSPNPLIPQDVAELKISKSGIITVDETTMMTNISGIFAGGDIVRGGATVILAMGDGRRAAAQIDEYLN